MKESLKLTKSNTDILELDDYPESLVMAETDDYYKGSPINLRSYWRAFIKYIWLVILIVIIGTALMLVHEARKPDYYVAWARVQVNTENNPALGASKNGAVVLNNQASDQPTSALSCKSWKA